MIQGLSFELLGIIGRALSLYSYLLIIRILLTWLPNLDWSNPVLSSISSITDPYLNIFRGIIPPLGMIDISPILAFYALNLGLIPLFSQLQAIVYNTFITPYG